MDPCLFCCFVLFVVNLQAKILVLEQFPKKITEITELLAVRVNKVELMLSGL